MDYEDSGIDSAAKNLLEVNQPKRNEPIITFSPDRTRFDPGQNQKSQNTSIASDFDLNLEVSYSKADIKVNQYQNQPPSTSFTDLLSPSSSGVQLPPTPFSQLNSSTNSGGGGDIINQFSLDLKQELSLSLAQNQSQQRASNGGSGNGPSMSTLVTASPATLGTSLTGKMSSLRNGAIPSGEAPTCDAATSTLQLQRKLEKKIAQASAIAAAMNSITRISPSPPVMSPKDETEFGDWNINTETLAKPDSNSNSSPSSKLKSPEPKIRSSAPNLPSSKTLSKSKSSKAKNSSKSRYSSSDNRNPPCVKFQENEVEIISRSSRSKVPGALIPPERLAVPHVNNANNARKHSNSSGGNKSASRVREEHSQKTNGEEGMPNTGSTSEVKPLVEWDSDESEEELSFFPTGKPKAKLTDNLSIDNMSLSGEEDDLHLSPPRHMTQKCPCDPRQWITDQLPKSNSFPGQGGQCVIS